MIRFGDKVEVWTFTGWEEFDWDDYDSQEEACEFLSYCGKVRLIED